MVALSSSPLPSEFSPLVLLPKGERSSPPCFPLSATEKERRPHRRGRGLHPPFSPPPDRRAFSRQTSRCTSIKPEETSFFPRKPSTRAYCPSSLFLPGKRRRGVAIFSFRTTAAPRSQCRRSLSPPLFGRTSASSLFLEK